ncbi:phosphatase PAP2 family protein [Cupriavidus gilardii]|uniref:phosphatase PAP2 family protein n=1 Tax=Cupriavidus gilardii TaxID=82541 RepID=UPI001FC98AF4|nr:phosphatase PAP2 family protein [Cupriavidus gilardii]
MAAIHYAYTEPAHACIDEEIEDTMDELIAAWPAWLRFEQPTPGLLIGGLLLFVVLTVLGLCLVRVALVLLHPVMRLLDALRHVARDALHARAGDRWPRMLKLLEREVAEILLVTIAAAVLLGSGGLLIWLALAVAAETPLVRIDQAVFAWLQQGRQDWLDVTMTAITEFGGARIAVAIGIAVFAWLAWRRAWAAAIYWAIALIGARACVMVLKYGLARGRPASIYGGVESFSFPSGHATSSMVTYGFLAFLLCVRQPWRVRIPVLAVTATVVVAIGLSRLYLGMHWLSDVVAGYALGMAWIVMLATAYLTLHAPARLSPAPLAGVAAAAALAMGAWVAVYHLPHNVERYRDAAKAAPSLAPPPAPATERIPARPDRPGASPG